MLVQIIFCKLAKLLSLTCELHVLVVLNDHRNFAKFLSLTWQVVYSKLAC